ncbi:MAG: InlB B-repeat-containing protein, partial [Syntrophomonadaceae bacterium]|nr:InlB B-repeat-containing protein [Syntrophomonadaceae bacterium]
MPSGDDTEGTPTGEEPSSGEPEGAPTGGTSSGSGPESTEEGEPAAEPTEGTAPAEEEPPPSGQGTEGTGTPEDDVEIVEEPETPPTEPEDEEETPPAKAGKTEEEEEELTEPAVQETLRGVILPNNEGVMSLFAINPSTGIGDGSQYGELTVTPNGTGTSDRTDVLQVYIYVKAYTDAVYEAETGYNPGNYDPVIGMSSSNQNYNWFLLDFTENAQYTLAGMRFSYQGTVSNPEQPNPSLQWWETSTVIQENVRVNFGPGNLGWTNRLYIYLDEKPTYTLTYDGNGADSGEAPTDSTAYYNGDTATLADDAGTLTKSGYTFKGWSLSNDNNITGTVEEVTFANSNITVYAVWEEVPVEYTVTYLPGDHGTFAQQETNALHYGDSTPEAPAATGEDGWSFDGWSPGVALTVTDNATYTAQWIKVTLAVPTATITAGQEAQLAAATAIDPAGKTFANGTIEID